MKTSKIHRDYAKVVKVIESCVTSNQVLNSYNMIRNYCEFYKLGSFKEYNNLFNLYNRRLNDLMWDNK